MTDENGVGFSIWSIGFSYQFRDSQLIRGPIEGAGKRSRRERKGEGPGGRESKGGGSGPGRGRALKQHPPIQSTKVKTTGVHPD